MVHKKTYLKKLKKGKLPSKKIIKEYNRLRKMGLSPKEADRLSRVKYRKKSSKRKTQSRGLKWF